MAELIELTEEQKKTLQSLASLIEQNRTLNPAGDGDRKGRWMNFLESTGGTALITVLIGGIFGTIISACIQSSSKDREFQQTWLQARGDQAMVGYKDFLEKQQETVKKIFERVGATMSASEDLISLSEPALVDTAGNLSPVERKGIAEQRTAIKERYNAADKLWNNERDILGMSVSYYFPDNPNTSDKSNTSDNQTAETNVLLAWDKVKQSVGKYKDCAVKWYGNKYPRSTENACSDEKKAVDDSLAVMNKSLATNRKYSWEGWESPEELKRTLNGTPKK